MTPKVMIVNGSAGLLDALETALEAGRYDIIFVESNDRAYTQIKRVRPNLVILCVQVDDLDGFQVLSMLKLDQETRDIPVLTYATEYDAEDAEQDVPEPAGIEMFTPKAAPLMN